MFELLFLILFTALLTIAGMVGEFCSLYLVTSQRDERSLISGIVER